MLDYAPIPCTFLSTALRNFRVQEIQVNTRATGGWDLYYGIRNSVSVWRYNKYLVLNNEDTRINTALHNNRSFWDGLEPLGNGNYGLLVDSWFVSYISSSFDFLVSRQTKGIKAEFNKKDKEKYETQRKKAIDILRNDEKCRKFLLSLNINPDTLARAVEKQRPYDGVNSTISRLDAGEYGPNDDFTNPRVVTVANSPISLNFTHLKYNAQTIFYKGATRVLGETTSERSDVYYKDVSKFSPARIIHEAMHSAFIADDLQLADLFGVTVKPGEDTGSITDALKKGGCGK